MSWKCYVLKTHTIIHVLYFSSLTWICLLHLSSLTHFIVLGFMFLFTFVLFCFFGQILPWTRVLWEHNFPASAVFFLLLFSHLFIDCITVNYLFLVSVLPLALEQLWGAWYATSLSHCSSHNPVRGVEQINKHWILGILSYSVRFRQWPFHLSFN